MLDLNGYKLVLGSASPRRKALLEEMGFSFVQRTVDLDEIPAEGLSPNAVAEDLARQKAEAIEITEGELLLCADTIVVVDHDLLAKPADREEALSMLRRISGRSHQVITGVCLRSLGRSICGHALTKVHFRELKESEMEYYIDEFQPFDKAGAYGIQEWIGMIGVDRIKGDYYNVVGLPCALVYDLLQRFPEE